MNHKINCCPKCQSKLYDYLKMPVDESNPNKIMFEWFCEYLKSYLAGY